MTTVFFTWEFQKSILQLCCLKIQKLFAEQLFWRKLHINIFKPHNDIGLVRIFSEDQTNGLFFWCVNLSSILETENEKNIENIVLFDYILVTLWWF